MPFTVKSPGPPPQPPEPEVSRFDENGRPTPQQIQYERRLLAWLRELLGWGETMAATVPSNLVIGQAFTPSLAGSTTPGTNTYATRLGFYSQVDKQISFVVAITLSAKDAAMAGNIRITGLPATNNAADAAVVVAGGNLTLSNASAQLVGYVPAGANYIALREQRSTTALTALTPATVGATATFVASGTYTIAP